MYVTCTCMCPYVNGTTHLSQKANGSVCRQWSQAMHLCCPCALLPAGNIVCQVSIQNTGTMGLASYTLGSTGNTLAAGCASTTPILPGQNSTAVCTVSKPVTQTDFDNREATPTTSLSVVLDSIAATSSTGLAVTKDASVTRSGLQLAVNRAMTVATSLGQTAVDATGKFQHVKLLFPQQ